VAALPRSPSGSLVLRSAPLSCRVAPPLCLGLRCSPSGSVVLCTSLPIVSRLRFVVLLLASARSPSSTHVICPLSLPFPPLLPVFSLPLAGSPRLLSSQCRVCPLALPFVPSLFFLLVLIGYSLWGTNGGPDTTGSDV
jgi:hypothetical protein